MLLDDESASLGELAQRSFGSRPDMADDLRSGEAAKMPASLRRCSSGQAIEETGSIKVAGASYVDDLRDGLGGDLDRFA